MLLQDRFVGTFGIIRAGDQTDIVKVAVQAARNGFAVVPLVYNSTEPACALGVRDAKKPHECYHPLTEDTKVRAAFNRLTKDGARVNLGIDLALSGIGVTEDVSWWHGPELSPTLAMPGSRRLYVFDLADARDIQNPHLITTGTLLVPPSVLDDTDLVQLIGQMNHLSDNKEEETEVAAGDGGVPDTLWSDDAQDLGLVNERLDSLAVQVGDLGTQMGKLQSALIVALTEMQKLKAKVGE